MFPQRGSSGSAADLPRISLSVSPSTRSRSPAAQQHNQYLSPASRSQSPNRSHSFEGLPDNLEEAFSTLRRDHSILMRRYHKVSKLKDTSEGLIRCSIEHHFELLRLRDSQSLQSMLDTAEQAIRDLQALGLAAFEAVGDASARCRASARQHTGHQASTPRAWGEGKGRGGSHASEDGAGSARSPSGIATDADGPQRDGETPNSALLVSGQTTSPSASAVPIAAAESIVGGQARADVTAYHNRSGSEESSRRPFPVVEECPMWILDDDIRDLQKGSSARVQTIKLQQIITRKLAAAVEGANVLTAAALGSLSVACGRIEELEATVGNAQRSAVTAAHSRLLTNASTISRMVAHAEADEAWHREALSAIAKDSSDGFSNALRHSAGALQQAIADKDRLEKELAKASVSLDEARNDLRTLLVEAKKSENWAQELQGSLSATEARLKERERDLEEALAERNEVNSHLDERVAALMTAASQLANETELAETRAGDAEAALAASRRDYEDILARLNAGDETQATEMDVLKSRLAAAEAAAKEAREQAATIKTNLEAELEKCVVDLFSTRDALAKAESEVARLQTVLADTTSGATNTGAEESENLRSRLSALDIERSQLEAQFTESRQLSDQLRAELEAVRGDCASMTAAMDSATSRESDLRKVMREAEADAAQAKAALSEKEYDLQRMQSQLEAARAAYDRLKQASEGDAERLADLEREAAEVEGLRKQHASEEARRRALEERLAKSEEDSQTKTQHAEDAAARLQEKHDAAQSALKRAEAAASQSQKQLAAAEQEVLELRDQMQTLELDRKKLKTAEEHLRAQLEALMQRIASYEETVASATEAAEQAKHDHNRALRQIDVLKATIERLRSEAVAEAERILALETAAEAAATVQNRLKVEEGRNASLEKQLVEAKEALTSALNSDAQVSDDRNTVASVEPSPECSPELQNRRIAELERLVATLQDEAALMKASAEEAQRAQATLKAEAAELQATLARLQQTDEHLRAQLATARERLVEAEDTEARIRLELDEAKHALQRAQRQLESTRAMLERLQASAAEDAKRLLELEAAAEELLAMKKKLDAETQKRVSGEAECVRLQSALDATRAAHEEATAAADRARQDAAQNTSTLDSDAEALQDKIRLLENDVAKLKEEMELLQQTLSTREKECKEHLSIQSRQQAAINDLENQLAEAKAAQAAALDHAKHEAERLRQLTAEQRETISKLEDELQNALQSIDTLKHDAHRLQRLYDASKGMVESLRATAESDALRMGELEAIAATAATLKARLTTEEKRRAAAEEELRILREQLLASDRAQRDLDAANTSIAALQQRLSSDDQRRAAAASDAETLKDALTASEGEIARLQRKISEISANQESTALAAQQETETSLEVLRARIASLESLVEAKDCELQSLKALTEGVTVEHSESQSRVQAVIRDLRDALQAAHSEHATLRTRAADAAKSYSGLEERLKVSCERRDEAERRACDLQSELSLSQEALQSAQEQLADAVATATAQGHGYGLLFATESAHRRDIIHRSEADFDTILLRFSKEFESKAVAAMRKSVAVADMLDESLSLSQGRNTLNQRMIDAIEMLRSGRKSVKGGAKGDLDEPKVDMRFRNIAWLVATRGGLITAMGEFHRRLYDLELHPNRVRINMTEILRDYLSPVEKLHIGLPHDLASVLPVSREANEKELMRILIHSATSYSKPRDRSAMSMSPIRRPASPTRSDDGAASFEASATFTLTSPRFTGTLRGNIPPPPELRLSLSRMPSAMIAMVDREEDPFAVPRRLRERHGGPGSLASTYGQMETSPMVSPRGREL